MSIRFDRLKQIADDVRRAPKKFFDLGEWGCGCAACAIGWHARFHRDAEIQFVRSTDPLDDSGLFEVVFGELDGWDAIQNYCGLNEADADFLFAEYKYNDGTDREAVASRINQFIRDHRESPVIEMKPSAVAPVAARQLEGESQ